MNRLLLSGLIALIGAGSAVAAALTPGQALDRLYNSGKLTVPAMLNRSDALKHESTVGSLYLFSSGSGYVILPDDDRAPALLAFSDSGSLSPERNPGLNYWLEYYNMELEYLKSSGVRTAGADGSWRIQREEIEPLIETEWNQEWPYNLLCPKVDGHETVTGCVATAMAQVMKYHSYPVSGKGSYSYYWEPGKEELSFDYANTPFKWNEMTDRYDDKSTETAKKAVAELMLGCGISVNMHYEPGGSGAATTRMGEALIDIFDYSPSLWMPNRAYYGYDEWEDMIYSDLAEGLPVLYSGAGTDGGHQFICDGYRADGYFHFNWGWGGLSNGYFLLTALNPDDLGVGGGAGGFNTSQIATLGVRPPKAGDKPTYIMYCSGGFIPEVKEIKAGETFRCSGPYFNYSLATLPEGSRIGMKFVARSSGDVRYVEGVDVGGIHLLDGRDNDQIIFPELADGTYTVTPVLRVDGEWTDVRVPVGYPSLFTATVKDNVAKLEGETKAKITIRDIDIPATIYRDHQFPMPFTVENTGDLEFYGTVTPTLYDNSGNEVAKSKFRPLDVEVGESQRITDYVADFSAIKDADFAAGDYILVFLDEAGQEVSLPVNVTVQVAEGETAIEVHGLTLDKEGDVADPSAVKFTFKVICTSGVYYGKLRIDIFPGDGGEELYNTSSNPVYLEAGQEKYVSITANLGGLPDGNYMAIIYSDGESMTHALHFTVDRQLSGISQPSRDSKSSRKIYSLDGRLLTEPLSPGIYIIDGKATYIR